MATIGVRRETKSPHERRAPVAPEHVLRSSRESGLTWLVEPSPIRVFSDAEYAAAGAVTTAELHDAGTILGVKEIPPSLFEPGKAYAFFSHTIKGQKHNMPMLRRILDAGCTLIDYEKITDAAGHRLVFFGYHAGVAGTIDTLWIVGHRLAAAGILTPLASIRQAIHYNDLADACMAVKRVGLEIADKGLPKELCPFVVGFTGYGHVSRGAQYVFNHLPFIEVPPEDLGTLFSPKFSPDPRKLYKVVFKEMHTVARKQDGGFDFHEYYQSPELYEGVFWRYLDKLDVMINCIYWEETQPKLVTRSKVEELYSAGRLRLKAIGDVSCDINGSVELTVKATTQDSPVLVFNPATGQTLEEIDASGIPILAVDNLPAELPRDSTLHFGKSLYPFLPALASLDRTATFESLSVPPEIKKATIVWNGDLTPNYRYLGKFVG